LLDKAVIVGYTALKAAITRLDHVQEMSRV
jgi:hypothetical protein